MTAQNVPLSDHGREYVAAVVESGEAKDAAEVVDSPSGRWKRTGGRRTPRSRHSARRSAPVLMIWTTVGSPRSRSRTSPRSSTG